MIYGSGGNLVVEGSRLSVLPFEKDRGGPHLPPRLEKERRTPPVAPCCGARSLRPAHTFTSPSGKQPPRHSSNPQTPHCETPAAYLFVRRSQRDPPAGGVIAPSDFWLVTMMPTEIPFGIRRLCGKRALASRVPPKCLRQGSRNRSALGSPESHSTMSPGSPCFPVSPPPARKKRAITMPSALRPGRTGRTMAHGGHRRAARPLPLHSQPSLLFGIVRPGDARPFAFDKGRK